MPVQLGARAEHGFDQPLGLMADCHRRIEHFLTVLERVAHDGRDAPLDDDRRRAVEAALTYFESAAPRHTEDEEQSLFPLLRRMDHARVRAAWQQLAALEADHQTASGLHATVSAGFRRGLESGSLDAAQRTELAGALRALREMYRHHIEVEEREIFPLAGDVLSGDELAQIGRDMARRRGVPPAPTSAPGRLR